MNPEGADFLRLKYSPDVSEMLRGVSLTVGLCPEADASRAGGACVCSAIAADTAMAAEMIVVKNLVMYN